MRKFWHFLLAVLVTLTRWELWHFAKRPAFQNMHFLVTEKYVLYANLQRRRATFSKGAKDNLCTFEFFTKPNKICDFEQLKGFKRELKEVMIFALLLYFFNPVRVFYQEQNKFYKKERIKWQIAMKYRSVCVWSFVPHFCGFNFSIFLWNHICQSIENLAFFQKLTKFMALQIRWQRWQQRLKTVQLTGVLADHSHLDYQHRCFF